MSKVVFEDKAIPASIEVGYFLLSKGYTIADSSGMAMNSLIAQGPDSFDLLAPRTDPDGRDLLSRLLTRRRLWWLGRLSGLNSTDWKFVFHGRQHTQLVKELAEELSARYDVQISIELDGEVPIEESYMSDWAM